MRAVRRLSEPLLEGWVPGGRIRFFTSPSWMETRRPDMPWHAVDDLWPLALGGTSVDLKRRLRSDWKEPRTVATSEGIVTIAPHFMAEGLFGAVLEVASGDREAMRIRKLRGRYRHGLTQGMKLMTSHLGPVERMLFAVEAMPV